MQITTKIGNLFTIFEKYEKLRFVPEQPQFLNSSVKIKNEFNNWVNITAAITKQKTGMGILFDNGDVIKGADKHLLFTGSKCDFLSDIHIGDIIPKADGTSATVIDKYAIDDTLFYDMTIDSPTHLYQTSNGFIHHNTFLAQQLAAKLGMNLLKYDMSEYQEKHSVAKLIGAPPGYVGFGDGGSGEGKLVNDLVKNPNSVLLLDEVEKAHPDIFTVLLQLLDEGRITGSTGKVADARNSIIIMSSNLGTADAAKTNLGFIGEKTGKSETSKAVDNFFLTELRGRITAMIQFNKLDDLSFRKIVARDVSKLADLIHTRNIKIIPTENLITHIIGLNKNSQYGAREINRIVDTVIKYPLAVELLRGNIANGSTINLDWNNDALVIIPTITTVEIPLVTV